MRKAIVTIGALILIIISWWLVISLNVYKQTLESHVRISLLSKMFDIEADDRTVHNIQMLAWVEQQKQREMRQKWLFSYAYKRASTKLKGRDLLLKKLDEFVGEGPPFVTREGSVGMKGTSEGLREGSVLDF